MICCILEIGVVGTKNNFVPCLCRGWSCVTEADHDGIQQGTDTGAAWRDLRMRRWEDKEEEFTKCDMRGRESLQ